MNALRLRFLAVCTFFSSAVAQDSAGARDVVVPWNEAALQAIRTAAMPPPPASRALAIVHVSMHDAVNGIDPKYEHYLVPATAPRDASEEAAAIAAAHDALVALFPTQAGSFDGLQRVMLDRVRNGNAKTQGMAWGQQVAAKILAARANDGAANTAPYPGSNEPGKWRPHLSFGNVVRPALLPLWGRVTPFALTGGSQFRPPVPPALTSVDYALEVLFVQFFGSKNSQYRSRQETEIALFWAYGPATSTPPGHWNQIAQAALRGNRDPLGERARLFALLNIALADACIVSWDCKYQFGLWRPITAIQLADQDGNPFTFPDTGWMPLLETPPFPEYTSGHSTFSGAAAAVLASHFGKDNVRFTVGSDDLPNVRRHYRSFSEAALESGMSRIFGGIHFMSANLWGLFTGYQSGIYAAEHTLRRLKK
jgi:hypothetical protein